MNQKYRDGLDAEVALISQMKRAAAERDSAGIFKPASEGGVNAPAGGYRRTIKRTVKKLFKSIVRLLWRSVKPFIQPAAFRMRRYMTEPLLDELRRSNAAMRKEILSVKEALTDMRNIVSDLASVKHNIFHADYDREDAGVMNGVIVVGGGGHAKVVIELLRASGQKVAYCVGGDNSPDTCLGVKVFIGDEHLYKLFKEGYSRAFVAIGDNAIRMRMADTVCRIGYMLVNAISPDAVISPSARFGKGIAVMAGAVVNAECRIEDFSVINTGATIDHDCYIGRSAHIAPNSALAGNVYVGAGTFVGLGSKIIPGIKLGSNAVIGAGSVVINDVPEGVVVAGTPAKIIEKAK